MPHVFVFPQKNNLI